MTQTTAQRIKSINAALALMPAWVKEKAKRYREQKKFAEETFGPVVKYIQQQQKRK
jgi:hypothetical protein